jgi:hypothetical protein
VKRDPEGVRPVVIVGAARSGTKFLRDVLAASPGTSVVPYDVNYLWRTGNESWPDDCLPVGRCDPGIAARIRRSLVGAAEIRSVGDGGILLEKTVSNCLRVPFVNAVLPDARFVHLVRDGRDVVESAMRMWTAPPQADYLLAKLRSFPLGNARYAFKYAWNMVAGRLGAGRGQKVWGPRYSGIDSDAERLDLLTVCATQWDACVTAALDGLSELAGDRVLTVRYEQFATSTDVVADLACRLGLPGVDDVVAEHRAVSRSDTIQSGRGLPAAQQARIEDLIGSSLARLGYS